MEEEQIMEGDCVYEPSYGYGFVERWQDSIYAGKPLYAVKFRKGNEYFTRWLFREEFDIEH